MEILSDGNLDIWYSGFPFWKKAFTNCLKIFLGGENFHEFAVTQCTTSTNVVTSYMKIDYA